jgi:hypothetical protein
MLKERCHLSDDAVAGLGRGVALQKAWLGKLSVATLALFVSLPVRGQGYPVKPVTFITPAAALAGISLFGADLRTRGADSFNRRHFQPSVISTLS